ncbi:UNVERIFIED_CONTAM: hypothetical protein GTU68_019839 [Idotea baltica]|nr:hypothetical protein [Idotea baltica]
MGDKILLYLKSIFNFNVNVINYIYIILFSCYFCSNWWPFFIVSFYILAPVPIFISRKLETEATSLSRSLAHFLTSGIVISAFALPLVLARSPSDQPVINWSACWLAITGNIFVFVTIFGFILASDEENVEYSMW